MVSATQTRPPLRWLSYVFIYIRAKFAILFTDNYPKNINSDTHNMLIFSNLANPASATFEGKKLIMRLITFFSFGESGRESDETLLNHIGCAANNVKKCFLQQKKSSNLKR